MADPVIKGAGQPYCPDGSTVNYRLQFIGAEIDEKDRAVLRKLFPNLLDRAFELLNQEALVRSLCTEPITEEMQKQEQRFKTREFATM